MSRRRGAVFGAVLLAFAAIGAVIAFNQQSGVPEARSFEVRVSGGGMSPSTLRAFSDDTVTVTISADREEEIHLHGYDLHFLVGPSQAVTRTFKTDKTGTYDIEIEESGTPLGSLVVAPRGLALPFFRNGASAAPAAHAGLHHHHNATAQEKTTPTYDVLLHFGALEPMVTPEEARAQHLKTGEVVLRGSPPPAINEGKHIGTHVFLRSTGSVVRNAYPSLTIQDTTAGQTIEVPVVMMEALDAGDSDLHYGNNVALSAGHALIIRFALNGETAVFNVTT